MSAAILDRLNRSLVGRYRVERQLGEGGMATVYVAEDLRHHRRVALKVLKPELAAVVGAERFLAEIETTAKLQHPHILPLFDSGGADGLLFYVMPEIEGESLRQRLDREHQLSVDDCVRIASQIAEALDYAHRHGVIHRDIKPANILIHDGQPVISDFGIALAVSASGAGRMTETGLSLGTPHYMSPEQATGDDVGPATDIWALGCVLYEMLAGEPPYSGSTPQAVLGKIITAKPPAVREERKAVPPNVEAAIEHALERVPADRFATAKDFVKALADPVFRHGVRATASPRSELLWKRAAIAASLASVAFAGAAAWAFFVRAASTPSGMIPIVTAVTAPPAAELGSLAGIAISPDERAVVFPAGDALLRRDLDDVEAVPIPGIQAAFMPFFSPDGEWVAYFDFSDNWLKRARLDGSEVQGVVEVPPTGRSGAWGVDGTIVLHSSGLGGLARVPAAGGPIDSVGRGSGPLVWLDLLPGGASVLGSRFVDGERHVVVVQLDTGEDAVLFAGTTPRYVRSRIVYWREGALWAVPFDVDRLEVTGQPTLLVQNVVAGDNGLAVFAIRENLLFYRRGGTFSTGWGAPVWIDSNGMAEPLPLEPGLYRSPRISPDGRRVALTRLRTNSDVWIHDLTTNSSAQLTFDPAIDEGPVWTPDGERIVFRSSRDGPLNLYIVRADGSEEPRRLTTSTSGQFPYEFTPDGLLLFGQAAPETGFDVWTLSLEPGASPTKIMGDAFDEGRVTVAPSGGFIAYESWELGYPEIFVRSFPELGGRRLVSTLDVEPANALINADPREARSPVWAPDGTGIFYQSGRAFVRVRLEPRTGIPASDPELVFENYASGFPVVGTGMRHYDTARDGGRLLMIDASALNTAPVSELILVQNWITLLDSPE